MLLLQRDVTANEIPSTLRRTEDANAEYYQSQYGTGSYPFGNVGDDSGCSLYWGYDGYNQPVWHSQCLNGAISLSDDGTQQFRRAKLCQGKDEDFDSFSCTLSTRYYDDNTQRFLTVLQISVECSGDKCTCQSATVQGAACDSCAFCGSGNTLTSVAGWVDTTDPLPLELTCPGDETYHVSQTCAAAWLSGDKVKNIGLFGGGLLVGAALAVAGTMYYYKTRLNHTNQEQKEALNETSTKETPAATDDADHYVRHDGLVA